MAICQPLAVALFFGRLCQSSAAALSCASAGQQCASCATQHTDHHRQARAYGDRVAAGNRARQTQSTCGGGMARFAWLGQRIHARSLVGVVGELRTPERLIGCVVSSSATFDIGFG